MTAEEILTTLAERRISARTDGRNIRLAPKGRLTPELRELILANKPELIAAIGEPVGSALGGVDGVGEELALMPLSRFSVAGLVVEVDSRILGEVILFASDNAVIDPFEKRAVYRAAELVALAGLDEVSPRDLRQVHKFKKLFRGRVDC